MIDLIDFDNILKFDIDLQACSVSRGTVINENLHHHMQVASFIRGLKFQLMMAHAWYITPGLYHSLYLQLICLSRFFGEVGKTSTYAIIGIDFKATFIGTKIVALFFEYLEKYTL